MNYLKPLLSQAKRIENTNDKEYIRRIIRIIHAYFDPAKYYVTTTNNFRLSRKASLNFIMKNRLRTCGSLSFIAAMLLKKLGYQTRLVDGKRKINGGHWAQHAWIEVKFNNKWQSFDLFAKDFRLDSKKNKKIRTYLTWRKLF